MIPSGAREIGDARLRLREITPADSPNLYRWRMDPSSRMMFRSTEVVSPAVHEALLARYFAPGNTDRWFIIEAGGEPVGAIALFGPASATREAEWGRLVVAPGARGGGHGRRALALLIEYARQIGLRRLRCEVLEGNAPAEAIYRTLGFVEVGREEAGSRTFRYLALEL